MEVRFEPELESRFKLTVRESSSEGRQMADEAVAAYRTPSARAFAS